MKLGHNVLHLVFAYHLYKKKNHIVLHSKSKSTIIKVDLNLFDVMSNYIL